MSVRKADAPDGAWCHGRGPSRDRSADVIAGPPPSSTGVSSAGRRLVLFSVGRMRSFPLPPRRRVLQSAPPLGPAFVAHIACADRGDVASATRSDHGTHRESVLRDRACPPADHAGVRAVQPMRTARLSASLLGAVGGAGAVSLGPGRRVHGGRTTGDLHRLLLPPLAIGVSMEQDRVDRLAEKHLEKVAASLGGGLDVRTSLGWGPAGQAILDAATTTTPGARCSTAVPSRSAWSQRPAQRARHRERSGDHDGH